MAGRVPREDREGGAATLSSSACAIFALWIEQVAGMRRWWCQRWQDWQRHGGGNGRHAASSVLHAGSKAGR